MKAWGGLHGAPQLLQGSEVEVSPAPMLSLQVLSGVPEWRGTVFPEFGHNAGGKLVPGAEGLWRKTLKGVKEIADGKKVVKTRKMKNWGPQI